jgi:ketosteroid isomerase-like protein
MSSTIDSEAILRGVLDRWKAAVDAHEPQRVASYFTKDAIFQGLHPYSVGRQGVADYYDSQPFGMTTGHRILETRQPADDLCSAGGALSDWLLNGRVPLLNDGH